MTKVVKALTTCLTTWSKPSPQRSKLRPFTKTANALTFLGRIAGALALDQTVAKALIFDPDGQGAEVEPLALDQTVAKALIQGGHCS